MSELENLESNEPSADPDAKPGTTRLQLLLRIAGVIVGVITVLGVIGWFLPSEYTVTAEVEIDAPPSEVYGMINRADLWPSWSPSWDFDRHEKFVHFYHIGFGGVTWSHEDMIGNKQIGKMWMDNRVPHERIEYYVERQNQRVFNYFDFESLEDGSRTKLVWTTEAKLPRKRITDGLFYGWAGLILKGNLKTQYDADLARLKDVCESSSLLTRSTKDAASDKQEDPPAESTEAEAKSATSTDPPDDADGSSEAKDDGTKDSTESGDPVGNTKQ